MSKLRHKVLFVCIHNSARSQMAEAFLNEYGKGRFGAESAGIEPGKLNPVVVQVMLEVGIDLSKKGTKGVFDLFKQGKSYDAVITVCDAASAERCPVFPGKVKRLAWSFKDPSSFKGSPEEVLNKTREIRDEIKNAILDFIKEGGSLNYWI
ncbi:MAG TPA: arsenate reductase ArsC [Chitinophagaceae bacterium]|nr:arsenate reductase ArsC [Chitinophagaceae bacterium]